MEAVASPHVATLARPHTARSSPPQERDRIATFLYSISWRTNDRV